MLAVRAVVAYLLFIFVGGALVAPWIYKLVAAAAGVFPALEGLARNPFHRFVNRSLILLALIGLWPFLKAVGVRSWRETGLGWDRNAVRWLGQGFALGFASLLVVAAAAWISGARALDLNRPATELLRHFTNALLAAVLVGFMEELLFRGTILGALRKQLPWRTALLISSAVYSIVHFFQRPAPPEAVGWATGFTTLAQMLRGFGNVQALVPGFFALVVGGCILGLAYQRSGSLYFSIGLHGGWIFWVKSHAYFTRELPGASLWIWGSGKLIDGWMSLIVLSAALAGLAWKTRRSVAAQALLVRFDSP